MNRIASLDYLKLWLAVGVVIAHAILFQDFGKVSPVVMKWEFLLGNAFLRSLVPTFSVLSGYCFYVTHQRGRGRKWILELLALYLFWLAFYMPLWMRDVSDWRDALWILGFGPIHLWYVSGLILACFLLVMLLRLCTRRGLGLWPILGLAALLALSGSAGAYWSFLGDHRIPVEIVRNGLTVVFPFVAVGYAIAGFVDRHGRDALPRPGVLWALTAVMFALKMAEAIYATRYGVKPSALPELPLVAYPAVVLLFLSVLRMDLPMPRRNLSLWSASIYFIHIFIFVGLSRLGLDNIVIRVLAGVLIPIALARALERAVTRSRRQGSFDENVTG